MEAPLLRICLSLTTPNWNWSPLWLATAGDHRLSFVRTHAGCRDPKVEKGSPFLWVWVDLENQGTQVLSRTRDTEKNPHRQCLDGLFGWSRWSPLICSLVGFSRLIQQIKCCRESAYYSFESRQIGEWASLVSTNISVWFSKSILMTTSLTSS